MTQMTTSFLTSFTRLPVALAVAGLLASAPFTLRLDPQTGAFALTDSTAEARRGRGADDRQADDRGGRKAGKGRGADDTQPDDRGGRRKRGGTATAPSTGPVQVVKVERSASQIEVRYSDGTKEEVEGGVYERKNSAGRTVEKRPATAADTARLSALR